MLCFHIDNGVQASMMAVDGWQVWFDRSSLSTSAMHSVKPWQANKAAVFSQIDTFLQRCRYVSLISDDHVVRASHSLSEESCRKALRCCLLISTHMNDCYVLCDSVIYYDSMQDPRWQDCQLTQCFEG